MFVELPESPLELPESFSNQDDQHVLMPGKLFECGEYPDKNFALTEEEADEAIAAFSPVNMKYGHADEGPLKPGAFGTIRRIWKQGKEIMAEFAVPSFLLDVAKQEKAPLKVSAEWTPNTKRLTGCAWVKNPRIPDAALIAAFSASNPSPRSGPNPTGRPLYERTTVMTEAQKKAIERMRKAGMEQSEIDATIAEFSRDAEAQIKKDGVEFAEKMVREKRALPAEKPMIVAAFCQAARDDNRLEESVTFSVNGTDSREGNRVDLLKTLFSLRNPHLLTDELLKGLKPDATEEETRQFALRNGGGGGAKEPVKELSASEIYAKRAKTVAGN